MRRYSHVGIVGIVLIQLILTGCPSARPISSGKKQSVVEQRAQDPVDAVRIRPEAAMKYLRLSATDVSRDGRTLRGYVVEGLFIEDSTATVFDTVWVFREVQEHSGRIQEFMIPIRDIVLLPTLYKGMVTDTLLGIDLVETYHVTQEIPSIRSVPFRTIKCTQPYRPNAVVPIQKDSQPCNCEPFEIGFRLSCVEKTYGSLAVAALLRASAYTDGTDRVSSGEFGFGGDVLIGYRFGEGQRWMIGMTFSTGITTVDIGKISDRTITLEDVERVLRPLILATGRYYFAGLDRRLSPPPPKSAPSLELDSILRFVNGQTFPCAKKVVKHDGPKTDTADSSEEMTSRRVRHFSPAVDLSPCDDCVKENNEIREQLSQRYQKIIDSILTVTPDESVRQFWGCLLPYVYGEFGVAVDKRTMNSLSMSLGSTCNECVAAIRDANVNGDLGLSWAIPVTFGVGAGIDIPLSKALDLEIDLGFRSIAIGDSYRRIGFDDVPGMRRVSSFQLRLGVLY